ncbi:MAG: XrtA system polysaccharide deacetylase [Spirochaetaceae bacterium]
MTSAENSRSGGNPRRPVAESGAPTTGRLPLAMSIDVEDWFQVENLKGAIPRDTWEQYPLRVSENTRAILDIFDETETKGTFFCLGWVAERRPELIAEIARRGHEVASHGYGHELLYEIGPGRFREDLRRARKLLEDASGQRIVGYRAPSFSITDWALEILAEEGYLYDSSYFPASGHDRYAKLPTGYFGYATELAPPFLSELPEGFTELSIPVLELFGKAVPWGGGGYFRLYPPALFRSGFVAAARRHGGAVFYLHPWEVDPSQPRVKSIKRSYAFRHYINLSRTAERLRQLCKHLEFTTCSSVLLAAAGR